MPKSKAVPTHLGLIPDGNRRWAEAHGLSTFEGHRRGYENLTNIGRAAIKRGIPYVSAYVLSTENWQQRSPDEVDYLLNLLSTPTEQVLAVLKREGIRLRYLGSRDGLEADKLQAMDAAEELTRDNPRGTLALYFNYGGLQEIVDAMRKINDLDIESD